MYTRLNPPPLSKAVWSWLREWQHNNGLSDEEFTAGLKLNVKTVKSYDTSAHTLTIEKLDNLVATVGVEPIVYVFGKYVEYIEFLNGKATVVDLIGPYYPQFNEYNN